MIDRPSPRITLLHADCIEAMRGMPDGCVDAVVTDPPYGLEFMGKEWDGADGFRRSLNLADAGRDSVFGRSSRTSPEYRAGHLFQELTEAWAREALRVLKPGGHLLAFGGSRTYHRLAVAIEDAGFEIRDQIMWVYGSGFPKSLDVSKAIDKAAGAVREVVGMHPGASARSPLASGSRAGGILSGVSDLTAPATDDAKQWQGWGTALKPAHEPIVVARKPLVGTVAANVLEHGTGALNIDGCRVVHANVDDLAVSLSKNPGTNETVTSDVYGASRPQQSVNTSGRWPANFIHDGSDEVVALFPVSKDGVAVQRNRDGGVHNTVFGAYSKPPVDDVGYGGSGSAARFFYTAKASKSERGEGNGHPTVKPLALMRYLCRLVTPPSGVILDPFMGSGTTGCAAKTEGFGFVGIEREEAYHLIARGRIDEAQRIETECRQGSLPLEVRPHDSK